MALYVRNILAAGFCLLCLTSAADANNLRGRVVFPVGNSFSQRLFPRDGVAVTLARVVPGGLVPFAHATTVNGGFYFFLGVSPGQYVLIVGGRQYPLQVSSAPTQDIPQIVSAL